MTSLTAKALSDQEELFARVRYTYLPTIFFFLLLGRISVILLFSFYFM